MSKINLNEMRRKLFERRWRLTIDIQNLWSASEDIFNTDYTDEDFNKFKTDLTKKLKTYIPKVKSIQDEDAAIEYENLIDAIESTDNIDEFGEAWTNLYDFTDDIDIWIKTF